MQFQYDLNALLPLDANNVAVITNRILARPDSISQTYNPKNTPSEKLADLIDAVGRASSEAQGLSSPVTNFHKLAVSSHRLYMKVEGNKVIGYIKVGEKQLNYRHLDGKFSEISPVCVLDFFVYPNSQRKGYGREIFEAMLAYEKTEARLMGYDRPSFKFKAFLARHYGLDRHVPQINHFVIFNQFFEIPSKENKYEQLNSKLLISLPVSENKPKIEPAQSNLSKPCAK